MSDRKQNIKNINPDFSIKMKKQKDISYYLDGLQDQNRFILSECITLLESTNPNKRTIGEHIIQQLPIPDQPTIRIGITGSPGVGKSTFIESFGQLLVSHHHRPAILAIDPSSRINKGSILGDKTRMTALAAIPDAYIRPSPSGDILGGIARYTKDAVHICEAAGYDIIIVETVGIGQSESEVDNITDINLLLLQPGAGDDIQGIKRGIVENADIFIINKADGDQLELAARTKSAYTNAVNLFHHDIKGWETPVLQSSAITHSGMSEIYNAILQYIALLKSHNIFFTRRQNQELRWFEKQAILKLEQIVFSNPAVLQDYDKLLNDISQNRITASTALQEMEKVFRSFLKC
jgi:LAO/AO transport system kinase